MGDSQEPASRDRSRWTPIRPAARLRPGGSRGGRRPGLPRRFRPPSHARTVAGSRDRGIRSPAALRRHPLHRHRRPGIGVVSRGKTRPAAGIALRSSAATDPAATSRACARWSSPRPMIWTANASEGDRSAETAIWRVWRRSVEKQPDSAQTSGLTVTEPVNHKQPFLVELIYDRARTTTRADRQRMLALDSD